MSLITLSFSENIPLLCLAPICIILPISRRIMYYRFSIMKISSYLTVFYEGEETEIYWETVQKETSHANLNQLSLRYYEPLSLQIICIFLYCISCDFTLFLNFLYFFCSVISTFYLIGYTIRLNSISESKADLIREYRQFKKHLIIRSD